MTGRVHIRRARSSDRPLLTRDRISGLSLPLWQQTYRELIDRGIGDVYSIMRPAPLAGVRSLGLPVQVLTEAFVAQRVSVRLTRIRVADVLPALLRRRPAIGAFFAGELPGGVYYGIRSLLR